MPCTLYLRFPCAASCLCICKDMQCNVPEHCWRLQTAKFAPTTHACAPRVLLKYSRDSRHASQLMKSRQDTNYSITSMEVSRFARQSEVSRMHLHGDSFGRVCANHSAIGTCIHGPEKDRPHGTDPLVTSGAEEATNETSNAIQKAPGPRLN